MTEGQGHRQTFSDVGQTRTTTGLFFPGVETVHDISDGYHTMGDLYDHRRALCVALARMAVLAGGETAAYRTKAHHPDGDPMFPGYFLVAFRTLAGQVTYHYKLKHWGEFEGVPERDHAEPYDGHTPADTLDRLNAWLA